MDNQEIYRKRKLILQVIYQLYPGEEPPFISNDDVVKLNASYVADPRFGNVWDVEQFRKAYKRLRYQTKVNSWINSNNSTKP